MTAAAWLAAAAGAAAAGAGAEALGLARAGARRRGIRGARIRPRRRAPLLGALTWIGRRIGVAPAPHQVARRLAAAGAPAALRPGDVVAARTGAAAVALLALAGVATAMPGRLGPLLAVAGPVAALHAPDLWLRRRAARRAQVLRAEVADVLDLLRVCVEAGRAPAAALAEVGRRHGGLLGRELARSARQLALGLPRKDVLGELAARCPLAEVGALVAALGRSDRHGAPLGPALAVLAADARAARARGLREQAARAAPKIQLVVALLLVPAVMLMVGAALAAAFAAT